MRSFTNFQSTTADLCNVSTSDTTEMTRIKGYINDSVRTMCNIQGGKLRFLESRKDISTVADQEAYQIPNTFRKLIDVYIYSGSGTSSDSIYSPEMVFDPTKWKRVLQYRMGTSSVPSFIYVENKKMYIQPIPSVTGNKITMVGRLESKELSIEDYTTGTIVSITNGATTVTGSGTSWNASMVGKYIHIAESSSSNGGDGFWYEIASVTSTTVLELVKKYEGTSISAGSSTYTIGQMSPIPSAYDIGVVYRSAALYWANQKDMDRSKHYWLLYDGGNEAGFSKTYGGIIGQMIENEGETEEGSYIPPYLSEKNTVSGTPYYFPNQDASGFS